MFWFWLESHFRLLSQSIVEFIQIFLGDCLYDFETKNAVLCSGIVATVFGATGFLGRYLVQQLGE